MPTIDNLLNTLLTDCHVEVESSPRLIDRIQHKQNLRDQDLTRRHKPGVPIKTVTPIAIFNPSETIQIKPFSLLHSIGLITTPPIPNLASLSSTWAIIRYLWAFEAGTQRMPRLLLSSIARDLDFHQKAVLSDEVGMGMAWYIMNNYFHTTAARDVSKALEMPEWPIDQQTSALPDYLFYDDPSGDTFIVECKGNQSSEDSTIHQMQRGTEQVPSIIFNDDRRSISIVIATCMLNNKTKVFIVDPDSENGLEKYFPKYSSEKAERIGPNKWQVKNDELFSRDSRLLGRAKALMFAGCDIEAFSQLPYDVQNYYGKYPKRTEIKERFETDYGLFVGVSENLRNSEGYDITFSKCILDDLRVKYSPFSQNSPRNELFGFEQISASLEYLERFGKSSFKSELEELKNYFRARSYSKDGTMVQLIVSKNH